MEKETGGRVIQHYFADCHQNTFEGYCKSGFVRHAATTTQNRRCYYFFRQLYILKHASISLQNVQRHPPYPPHQCVRCGAKRWIKSRTAAKVLRRNHLWCCIKNIVRQLHQIRIGKRIDRHAGNDANAQPQPDIRFNHIRIGCSSTIRGVNPARLKAVSSSERPVKLKVYVTSGYCQRFTVTPEDVAATDDPASPLSNGSSDSTATSPVIVYKCSVSVAIAKSAPFDTASAICVGDPAYAAKRADNRRSLCNHAPQCVTRLRRSGNIERALSGRVLAGTDLMASTLPPQIRHPVLRRHLSQMLLLRAKIWMPSSSSSILTCLLIPYWEVYNPQR
ncbi:hypothetical protein KCP77_13780 [Salmonella enterica subsp. enterica]|nr:hypothetical protein KCP77_13780 [Salmonella enterica subsp. enterica]